MSLNDKIKKAKEIIKKAAQKWNPKQVAVAWTGGKDSTVLLHLIKAAFSKPPRLKSQFTLSDVEGGKPRELKKRLKSAIPFRVMFNDSTIEFPEVYDFIKKLKKDWQLDLIWQKHLSEDLEAYRSVIARNEVTKQSQSNKEQAMEIMRIAKINAINYVISKYKIKAFMSGIRWDEHEARSEEKYFSPRSTHTRVHPILHFTLDDVWEYIKLHNVPYVSLYDKGYKSLGEAPFTQSVKDKKAPERAGREATKEKTMERLRQLGYW